MPLNAGSLTIVGVAAPAAARTEGTTWTLPRGARRMRSERPAKKLAADFGVHRVTVSAILKRHGVLRPSGIHPRDLPDAIRCYRAGWSSARRTPVAPLAASWSSASRPGGRNLNQGPRATPFAMSLACPREQPR